METLFFCFRGGGGGGGGLDSHVSLSSSLANYRENAKTNKINERLLLFGVSWIIGTFVVVGIGGHLASYLTSAT